MRAHLSLKRVLGIVLVATIVSFGLWYLQRSTTPTSTPSVSTTKPLSTRATPASRQPLARRWVKPTNEDTLIDVSVSAKQVCLGGTFAAEANVIPGTSSSVLINGKPGKKAVLKATQLGEMEVVATAYRKDIDHKEAKRTTVNVVSCPEQTMLTLSYEQVPFKPDQYQFQVTSSSKQPPAQWHWSFGDGHHTKTTTPTTTHSYKMRAQTSRQAQMVVTVSFEDAKGKKHSAHAVVSLVNRAWILGQKNIWRHPVSYKAIPEYTNKAISSPIHMRNIRSDAQMHFERVEVKHTSCLDRSITKTTTHDPKTLLGFDTLEPGDLVQSHIEVPLPNTDKTGSKQWCRWQIEVHGAFDDGTPAQAYLSMEHGAPRWLKKAPNREEIKAAFRQSILKRKTHVPYRVSKD